MRARPALLHAVTLILLAAAPARAQQPAPAQLASAPRALVVSGRNLMAEDDWHKAAAARGGNPSALLPGDVILYQLRFTNVTKEKLQRVVFTNPVPVGLRYVGGSAAGGRPDVAADYSIDGGRTYEVQPMVVDTVDGQPVRKPAPAERYTHIRWTVQGWVERGAKVTAEYRAAAPSPAKSNNADEGSAK